MPKYIAPAPLLGVFTCPFCDVTAVQNWSANRNAVEVLKRGESGSYVLRSPRPGDYPARVTSNTEISEWAFSECANCHHITVWHRDEVVFPSVCPVEEPNYDMPEDVKADYREAASVLALSPKSSAALLRLALQKLMRYILGDHSTGKIYDDIKLLRERQLDTSLVMALDTIRISGNESVHPGTISLDDHPEDARYLFTILNMICDSLLTQPRRMREAYDRLPESKRFIS